MSWCNKLASTPAVGFKLDPHFASGDSILQALSPILDDLGRDGTIPFSVDQYESFAFGFNTEAGFKYGVDSSKVHVNFNHRAKTVPVSGGAPRVEMLTRSLPYTELLSTSSEKLIEATSLLPNIRNRLVRRVGIVSITNVSEEDLPPGIARFIEYFSKPWIGNAEHYNYVTCNVLRTKDDTTDKCTHTITKSDDPSKLITLQFDWQRTYENGRASAKESLGDMLRDAQRAALSYFEDLAEGSRFDEELLVNSASA